MTRTRTRGPFLTTMMVLFAIFVLILTFSASYLVVVVALVGGMLVAGLVYGPLVYLFAREARGDERGADAPSAGVGMDVAVADEGVDEPPLVRHGSEEAIVIVERCAASRRRSSSRCSPSSPPQIPRPRRA